MALQAASESSQPSLPKTVQCIRVACNGEHSLDDWHRNVVRFGHQSRTIEVPETHPVFTEGAISPISQLIELSLRIFRLDPRPSLSIPRSDRYVNEPATSLMKDPDLCITPPAWQVGVGSVILARDDKKPLHAQHVEALWMFSDVLRSREGNDFWLQHINRGIYGDFWERYGSMQLDRPEWALDVRACSPYEI